MLTATWRKGESIHVFGGWTAQAVNGGKVVAAGDLGGGGKGL